MSETPPKMPAEVTMERIRAASDRLLSELELDKLEVADAQEIFERAVVLGIALVACKAAFQIADFMSSASYLRMAIAARKEVQQVFGVATDAILEVVSQRGIAFRAGADDVGAP